MRLPQGWKERIGYGQWWRHSFSGFKGLFGEVVAAKRFKQVVREIELKIWVYNLMLGLTAASVLSRVEI